MKKIRNVILILAIFLGLNGCEREPVSDIPVQSSSQFTVEQAQAWFGINWTGAVSLKSGSIEKARIGIKPDWCNGFTSQNDVVEVVEVGLLIQGRFDMADEASYKEWEKTKNEKMITSLTRMVFLKYKKDGRIDQFLMTIVGDKEYHDKNIGKLADNSYLTMEKHFSGKVYFHDVTGKFINGWIYEKGKVVGKITPYLGGGLPIELKMATTCLYVTVNRLYQVCTDHYYVNGTGVHYNGFSCGTMYVENQTHIECPVYFTGEQTYGVSYVSDVNDPTPPPPAPEPCACLNVCPVCKKCKDNLVLKSANTNCVPAEVCTCPVPVPVVDTDDLQRNAKAYCIYQRMINGGILSGFIGRYFGITKPNQSFLGELNLTWKLGAISNAGETVPIGYTGNSSYYSVEIILNQSTMDTKASSLVAMTMLHEALHAKLIAEYYDTIGSTDFESLFKYYKGWGNGNIDTNQETEMLNMYANDMASALQSFDQGRGINLSLSTYTEALKYSLSADIFGLGSYPSGSSSYEILRNSSINCN